MNMNERINSGYYITKVEYPDRKLISKETFQELLKEYSKDQYRLEEQFKYDLFEELGITNNPKRDLLFSKAWELGHSSGYREVRFYAQELVELIQ